MSVSVSTKPVAAQTDFVILSEAAAVTSTIDLSMRGEFNHTPQGIELYHGKVILYSTGDFIDDYAVDPQERNDLSFLFVLDLDRMQARTVRLYQVAIERFQVRLARGAEITLLEQRMQTMCAVFRTKIQFQNGQGMITAIR